ncbi:cell division cycle-associated protein 7-like [Tubulanus polymorphus]|uniref:cell division cycle-associated protein 7-like n=1 Tax=Tubulanus polymorphus TaxID=672921 RepID=UPI003DA35C3C
MDRLKSKLSEYELERLENIRENKELLSRLMADLDTYEFKQSMMKAKPQKTQKRSKRASYEADGRTASARVRRLVMTDRSPPRTRSRAKNPDLNGDHSDDQSDEKTENRMVIKLGFFGSTKRKFDSDDDNSNDSWDGVSPPKRIRVTIERDFRSADDITQDDLDMVADVVSVKKYDHIRGTTCHQCRQKTFDMKTICRSPQCVGVRGQFCGVCLRNRYGEDAKEALKNSEWHCPPCRGICNCSICRRRAGVCCTGILVPLARERGFKDVNAYLQSLRG